jgi:hypothetical protein
MGRVRPSAILCAAFVGALLCGCVRTETHTTVTKTRTAAVENPSDFPLYPHSSVVEVVPVNSAQMFAAIKASDSHADLPSNFRGHEVIAETNASMTQLGAWLHTLKASPPRGLHKVSDKNTNINLNNGDRDIALGAHFETAGGTRSVYVVVADPKRLHDQLGPVFAMIDNYNAVPGVLRGPIDDQAKKQVGYSVSEMLDAKSPVGAIIATLERMQSTDRRAILVIDESRQ